MRRKVLFDKVQMRATERICTESGNVAKAVIRDRYAQKLLGERAHGIGDFALLCHTIGALAAHRGFEEGGRAQIRSGSKKTTRQRHSGHTLAECGHLFTMHSQSEKSRKRINGKVPCKSQMRSIRNHSSNQQQTLQGHT